MFETNRSRLLTKTTQKGQDASILKPTKARDASGSISSLALEYKPRLSRFYWLPW